MSSRLAPPYPEELLQVAKKVVWYDRPEQTLRDLETFLAHLMVYGSPGDLAIVERYVPEDQFRRVLEDAPAGVFTLEAWTRWHERFGLPVPLLPRRRFPGWTGTGRILRQVGIVWRGDCSFNRNLIYLSCGTESFPLLHRPDYRSSTVITIDRGRVSPVKRGEFHPSIAGLRGESFTRRK